MAQEDVFAIHLDLGPLRGRRAGLVRCPFHDDGRASLSVDLDRGLFHCFGCGAKGGRRAFAEQITQVAGAAAFQLGRRQAWAREPTRTLAELQDWIRRTRREIEQIRAQATDDERGWALLAVAADLERVAFIAEQEVDLAMEW